MGRSPTPKEGGEITRLIIIVRSRELAKYFNVGCWLMPRGPLRLLLGLQVGGRHRLNRLNFSTVRGFELVSLLYPLLHAAVEAAPILKLWPAYRE